MDMDTLLSFESTLNWFDYSVVIINLLLFIFAQPILKRFSAPSIEEKVLTVRFNLLRIINVLIVAAYVYQEIFHPDADQGIAVKILSVLVVIYSAYVLNYLAQFYFSKHYCKKRQIGDQTLYIQTYQSRLVSILTVIVITIASGIFIIQILNFDSMLQAGGALGVFGVMLALTQASWAPDIISGLIILNSDMFEEGDIVEFDGLIGRVYRTKLFHTEIINLRNNHRIMIRNANMRDRTIHNLTKFASGIGIRECMSFKIGYDAPIDQTRTMFESAFKQAIEEGIKLEDDAEVQVKIMETGDHAITWGMLFLVKKVDQLINIRRHMREAVLNQSNKHGIPLATPITQDVRISNDQ